MTRVVQVFRDRKEKDKSTKPQKHTSRFESAPGHTKTIGMMELSNKELRMISFAIDRWIEDLEGRTEDCSSNSNEIEACTDHEIKIYEALKYKIDEFILKQ